MLEWSSRLDMSIKLVNFHRAAAERAPVGATHWRLLSLSADSHPDFDVFPDKDLVLHGTLVFEWTRFDPRAGGLVEGYSEWTQLRPKYTEEVASKSTVFNDLEPDVEDT